MFPVWNFFLRKKQFTFLLVGALILGGFISLLSIPKESAPEIQIPIGIVSTFMRGASPTDIEELVTNPLEDEITNLDNLKEITSSSREAFSTIVVEFKASADIDESIEDLKDLVDRAKAQLPRDAEEPTVSDVNFADEPILLISIASDIPIASFSSLSETLVRDLKSISGVSRIASSGIPEKEIQVIVRKEELEQFNLRLVDVVSAISSADLSIPIGTITTNNIEYSINLKNKVDTVEDIASITITERNGHPIFVRDVAFISDGIAKTSSKSRLSVNGNPAEQSLTLTVFKNRGANILAVTDTIEKRLVELEETLLKDTVVLSTFSSAEFIRADLSNLSRSGLQTVLLVILLLLITIGWRESLIAGLAIPLSFLISFIGLLLSGNTINFISLFALILAVGILVDSAIVVTEAIHTKVDNGTDSKTAARETLREFSWPLISGTMTTIAAFFPLFFISGITGKFIASIPYTIIFVLSASLIVALAIIPLVASTFIRRRNTHTSLRKKQEYYTHCLQNWYREKIHKLLGHRKRENIFLVGIVVALLLSFILPATGAVRVIFFAQDDQDFLFIDLEAREGTTIDQTDLATRAVEEVLYDEPNIESFVTTIGSTSNFTSGQSGGKFANISINLYKNRSETSVVILNRLRENTIGIHGIDVSLDQPTNGPPVGKPVVITFLGHDGEELARVAEGAEKILKDIDGTTDVDTSSKNDSIDIILTIDRTKTIEVGLSPQIVAQTLRSAVAGSVATTVRKDGKDVDIVVALNLNKDYRNPHEHAHVTIDSLRQMTIEGPKGSVLIGSLITATPQKGAGVISHKDRKRTTSVESELLDGFSAREINKEFTARLDELNIGNSVTLDIGGESEDLDQSFRDMFVALIFGSVLMLSILILQFNSFRYAFFIIIIVPFSLIGILVGLAISGKALSFPSIMGFITLSGIVVNNSIILIDAINHRRRAHPEIEIREHVIEGTVSRLRPILLTTVTTVIGIFPLVFASDLWGPLAYAVMFGLSFAVILTLILVPLLYNRWPGKELPE
ncbi:hypothetical protein COB55_00790 [Candidatus Wolfebacteria bacterium]|nr:MAG: hypothetical protein COB55_00790 [Candidatus Wolfebacteria bacterium]